MEIKIELEGVDRLQKELKELVRKHEKAVAGEVAVAALNIQKEAKVRLKDYGAVDTGHLRRSILVDYFQGGTVAEIGPTAPYGLYVEFGTRPHFPPPDALESWARHHGFDSAWPICRAIAERGLPEKPYLLPAFEAEKKKFRERLEKKIEELLR